MAPSPHGASCAEDPRGSSTGISPPVSAIYIRSAKVSAKTFICPDTRQSSNESSSLTSRPMTGIVRNILRLGIERNKLKGAVHSLEEKLRLIEAETAELRQEIKITIRPVLSFVPRPNSERGVYEGATSSTTPFTQETAIQKVRLVEDGWNTRDPDKVSLAYTLDSK